MSLDPVMVPVCGVPRKGPDTTLQVSPVPEPRAAGESRRGSTAHRLELLSDGVLIAEGNEVGVKDLLVTVRDDVGGRFS